jgi:NADPH:quinone reductase-like Zn-dependent oxidoreductase
MKAALCEQYGPPEVFTLQDVAPPVPGPDEVLIRVRATTVNAADCNLRGLTYVPPGLGWLARLMLGIRKPKISIMGSVLAGEVVQVGAAVTEFKVGDAVFGAGPQLGGYAELACRPAAGALALMPENLSFLEAAAVPYGALTALYFLRDQAKVGPGQKVLVRGASGGVGVFAVQLARYFGAEVTGVCSGRHTELVRSLGAARVIDYTREDFTQLGEQWDVIFDVVVGQTSFATVKPVLKPKGYYLPVAGGLNDMLQMLWTSIFGSRKVVFGGGESSEKKENLVFLKELIESGDLRPVVDRTFTLDEIAAAHRQVETGRKQGSVVVEVP